MGRSFSNIPMSMVWFLPLPLLLVLVLEVEVEVVVVRPLLLLLAVAPGAGLSPAQLVGPDRRLSEVLRYGLMLRVRAR